MHHGNYMIHGHQHLRGDERFGNGRRMDIGMCGSDEFRPYHIEEIIAQLEMKKSNTTQNGI